MKQFTKSDLKTGMRVRYADGRTRIVLLHTEHTGGIVISAKGDYNLLSYYTDTLSKNNGAPCSEIVAVYTAPRALLYFLDENKHGGLLWERNTIRTEVEIELEELQKQIDDLSVQAKRLEQIIKN